MLWVAPQERSVNVPASNISNAIFRRIISALHGRRLGLTEELDASVTGRVAALCKDANLRRFTQWVEQSQVNSGRGRLEWGLSYESEAGDELTRATEESCNPYQRIEWAVLVQYGRLWITVYITIVWPTMKAGRA